MMIFDAGTGIRKLGKDLNRLNHKPQEGIFIGFSHFHWDHIQGFPFFEPAYDPGQTIRILAPGEGRTTTDLREIFEQQMQSDYFPVQLDNMGAKFAFHLHNKESMIFNDTKIITQPLNHPGGSVGYRVERNGKVLVLVTDHEHGETLDQEVVEFCRGADLLIHDAQYTAEELEKHRGWGHSSHDQALEVAEQAEVKRLIMTHHDPDHDDNFLQTIESECMDRLPIAALAREGWSFVV